MEEVGRVDEFQEWVARLLAEVDAVRREREAWFISFSSFYT